METVSDITIQTKLHTETVNDITTQMKLQNLNHFINISHYHKTSGEQNLKITLDNSNRSTQGF